MDAEIVAIGSELLTPFRQDTNSLFLTERLNAMGIEVRFKAVVGDRRADLVDAAKTALRRADLVIFMGGLGPTEDDLTRECVAEALGRRLRRDPDIIADLYKRFSKWRTGMPANNERQADVVEGAEVVPNANGSAPGQFLRVEHAGTARTVVLMPGPPHELKAMFDREVAPRLGKGRQEEFIAARELRVAMMPESLCDSRIAPIYTRYQDVETTILAGAGDISLHLRARAASLEEADRRVASLAGEIEDELEEAVYSANGEHLEQIVGYFLQLQGATLAVAESCTGGQLAKRVTSVAGSSRYFVGGAVVYSNALKTQFAGVPPELIAEHGAVSREVAASLAEGIRSRSGSTYGLGVTGIAGPAGGSEEKPVGLVYHALSDGRNTEVVERKFPGDRQRVRSWAAQQALDMLRLRLMRQ
ncbi:MAG: competence/damage-inducible protein A [Acidobacteria bacterium]|nr:competence/damage-inducible protein A [Acidobacteriota bacterium]